MTIHAEALKAFPWLQFQRFLNTDSASKEDLIFLATIPKLHQGWEIDDWFWLVDYHGQRYLLTTHQGVLEAFPPPETLDNLRTRYTEAITAIEETLALF